MSACPRGIISFGLVACLSSALWSCADHEASAGHIVRATTGKPFDDVVFELNFAITQRNFRITGRNTIGQGLRDRGYHDFPDVEIIHFCSLEVAREALSIDPGYAAQMPCRIAVHEEHGKTVISVILLPEDHADERLNAFARRMNATMRDIVDFVLERQ